MSCRSLSGDGDVECCIDPSLSLFSLPFSLSLFLADRNDLLDIDGSNLSQRANNSVWHQQQVQTHPQTECMCRQQPVCTEKMCPDISSSNDDDDKSLVTSATSQPALFWQTSDKSGVNDVQHIDQRFHPLCLLDIFGSRRVDLTETFSSFEIKNKI